jgi:hypothetical protein
MGNRVSVTGLTDVADETSQLCPGQYIVAVCEATLDLTWHKMMMNVIVL